MPTSANTAIPIENDAVLFVIARISSFRVPSNDIRLAAVDAPNSRAYSDPILFGAKSWRPATAIATLCLTVGRRSGARVAYATIAASRCQAHSWRRPTTRYPQYRELIRLARSTRDVALRACLLAVQPARPVVGDLCAPGAGRPDDHRLDRQPFAPRGDAASPPRCDRQAAAGDSGAAGYRGHARRAAALYGRVGGRPGGLRFRAGDRLLPRLGAGDPRPELAPPVRQQVVRGDGGAGVQRRLPAGAASQHRRCRLRRAGRLPLRAVPRVRRGPHRAGRGFGRGSDGRRRRARRPRRRVAGAGWAGAALTADLG